MAGWVPQRTGGEPEACARLGRERDPSVTAAAPRAPSTPALGVPRRACAWVQRVGPRAPRGAVRSGGGPGARGALGTLAAVGGGHVSAPRRPRSAASQPGPLGAVRVGLGVRVCKAAAHPSPDRASVAFQTLATPPGPGRGCGGPAARSSGAFPSRSAPRAVGRHRGALPTGSPRGPTAGASGCCEFEEQAQAGGWSGDAG